VIRLLQKWYKRLCSATNSHFSCYENWYEWGCWERDPCIKKKRFSFLKTDQHFVISYWGCLAVFPFLSRLTKVQCKTFHIAIILSHLLYHLLYLFSLVEGKSMRILFYRLMVPCINFILNYFSSSYIRVAFGKQIVKFM